MDYFLSTLTILLMFFLFKGEPDNWDRLHILSEKYYELKLQELENKEVN